MKFKEDLERIKEQLKNSCVADLGNIPSVDKECEITLKEGKKYTKIDIGPSGAFMMDNNSGDVFNIKSYGVVDLRKRRGNVKELNGEKLYKERYIYLR